VSERVRRRSESKQETREALIAAALAEFAEHGLDAPSLDAICARAGYTRGAFYVHFRDRGDLLVAVVEHAMTVFMDAVIATGGAGHDLERTIDRFAGAVAGSLGVGTAGDRPALPLPAGVSFARVLEGVMREPRLKSGLQMLLAGAAERLAAITTEGQRAGTIRDDVDAQPAAQILLIVALGIMVALDVGLPLDPLVLRDAVLRLLAARPGGGSASGQ
jgi:TetR/AcrR family transcriptional regulator, transcriptional repressor for nem operon